MPFVLRTVQPVHLSRRKLTGPDGRPLVQDQELEAVFNGTLCCAIRQLASLLEVADDLFGVLTKEMTDITERASALQRRVRRVQERVDSCDPKLVTVPEGDLCAFAALPRERHFHPERGLGGLGGLFVADSRPGALQRLYDAAARPTLDADALAQLDRLRRDGARSSTLFLCTPVLGRSRAQRLRRKVVDIDIETRKPASIVELRRWTSTEALGDITVHPDCTVRIASDGAHGAHGVLSAQGQSLSDNEEVDGDPDRTLRPSAELSSVADQTDHQLPTTEEQVKAIADRFPPEVVKVDVSGKSFVRMTQCRRSLIHPPTHQTLGSGDEVARRRTRPKRQRSRRRNTIAGTDQKEIEEALNGPGNSDTITTVDDIVLSSSNMVHSNPKSTKETSADFKKWAFNSLRRWGRSRLRAISSINSSVSSNIVSGELHAADPVDDINVYETVAGKRRGAGTIPISAGLSGPMSLAVKLREGSLGQRRLKINDEPPHSSSGNWSASSESGRASVNSDSSHQPKSSTCSSIIPHRRRFINNSTSSSVTSEGTLTPEDMAAAPFLDDGETSSVYSCDTEGYYTSFHMDSGLKTLKEEETGTGLSLPPTPMHSTSALSNCSSGRGSASLAQLTAESEYELFGKGSTSTTASSAGTVCTTLLVDNSKGGEHSYGSERSLCKAPAVPERKSSLNVPCLGQECPPCSTVVALIHNASQSRSPDSVSGDSPDSGHNTSSSPVESISCAQDTETDALISPIPSISSEMEFSECSDFEGTDRIERIRVKTTINTSRIPSMCAISPPQSDDETSSRQNILSSGDNAQKLLGQSRPAAPLPNVSSNASLKEFKNDNHRFIENCANQLSDNNANKSLLDDKCNARRITGVTSQSLSSVIHVDSKSGYATVHSLDNACQENNNNKKIRPPSPSGGTLFINTAAQEEPMMQLFHQQPLIKEALIPFSNMLSKFRKAPTPERIPCAEKTLNCSPVQQNLAHIDCEEDSSVDESGEYVTITDVRNNNKPDSTPESAPRCSERPEPARESSDKSWESLEYVSLNELPITSSKDLPSAVLSGSSLESSLERKRRQGARVKLDSEGKVVYSSDSLRRRKGAHTTFAPGQCVKNPSEYSSSSPIAKQRMPKAIIRPVQMQASEALKECYRRSSSKSPSKSSDCDYIIKSQNEVAQVTIINNEKRFSPSHIVSNKTDNQTDPPNASSVAQPPDFTGQRSKVIIRAGVSSPTKDLTQSCSKSVGRAISPRPVAPSRGAYVHIQPNNQSKVKTTLHPAYLQTDFDGPDDSTVKNYEGISSGEPQETVSNQTHPSSRSTSSQNQNVYQNVTSLRQSQSSTLQPQVLRVGASSQLLQLGYCPSSSRVFTSKAKNEVQALDAPLHSSTPTKIETRGCSPLTLSHTFSPIEKNLSHTNSSCEKNVGNSPMIRQGPWTEENFKKTSLISPPRTTMTSEELYAKIHRSKKQMKIKCEPEMLLGTTPSACGSQSPASSERSESPNCMREPRGPRSRHSWSPNSSKYLDVASNFDIRSSTPPNPQKSNDHGLTQVTSNYDFKRLLLQHGTGTGGRSKLSAVERLKLAKQAATNVFTNNASKLRFGASNSIPSRNTAGIPSFLGQDCTNFSNLKSNSKSALSKPGSKSARRFAANKSDLRSFPIPEDNCEDEQLQGVLKIKTLAASPMPARNFERIVSQRLPLQRKLEMQEPQLQRVSGTFLGSQVIVPKSEPLQDQPTQARLGQYHSQDVSYASSALPSDRKPPFKQVLPHSEIYASNRAKDGTVAALETAL